MVDNGAERSSASATPSGQLVQEEGREAGSVRASVYLDYALYIGMAITVVLCVAMLCGQGIYLASDLWLAFWSKSSPSNQGEARQVTTR